ncbi:polymer-forming cytoskeletal protein [Candidatus Dependentiae bacterium]|nr:polymer-forming cytoskeletal protein [Candidatus Dependentiae bacterium]
MKRLSILILLIILLSTFSQVTYAAKDDLFYTIEEKQSQIKETPVTKPKDKSGLHFTTPGKKHIGFGNRIIIGEHEILYEDLSLINSVLIVKGTLNGTIKSVYGVVIVEGKVNGDINIFGGELILKNNSVVNGNISFIGKTFEKEEKAIINGHVIIKKSPLINLLEPLFTFIFKGAPEFKLLYSAIWFLVKLGMILIIIYYLRKSIFRIKEAVKTSPFLMLTIGLLLMLVFASMMFVSAISIVLLPIGISLFIILLIISFYAYAILTSVIGGKFVKLLKLKKPHWTIKIILGYIVLTLFNLIPTAGFIAILIMESFILGAIVITGFGRRNYIKIPKGVKELNS